MNNDQNTFYRQFEITKRDGKTIVYSHGWPKKLIRIAADKVFCQITDEDISKIEKLIYQKGLAYNKDVLEYEEFRDCIREGLKEYPDVLNAYLNTHAEDIKLVFEDICRNMSRIMLDGDKSSGVVDSKLVSSKRTLMFDSIERSIYRNYVMSDDEREAFDTGYIYVHDLGSRRDTFNCCLFDMESVLKGGFEMGNIWYEEPASLLEAFDVIGSVVITASAQIYGGFTVSQIDKLLSPYAEKSYNLYRNKYLNAGISLEKIETLVQCDLENDFYNGFKSLEYRFNTIISPRGDYPFITVTFGLCRNMFEELAVQNILKVRENGQGKEGFKRPVLFPKLVFLFDHNLHTNGKPLEYLFELALECSSKVMYPEFLSLTGEGYVASMYKKYGEVVSPMCCRAFLSPWYENGGMIPANDNDKPVFIGRFNFGVVSLNLPLIYQTAKTENIDFFEYLDGYLQMIRNIHKKTYKFLSKKKAYTNPLAFMEGGIYGGHLKENDTIEPLLKSATASFGFTALNELQQIFNGKSLYEDGDFSLSVIKHINEKSLRVSKRR